MSILNEANIIREKRNNIKISIEDNKINIYCPFKLSYEKIEKIVCQKERLILKKFEEKKLINQRFIDIINYKYLLITGEKYIVISSSKIGKAYFTDNSIFVPKKYFDAHKEKQFIKKTLIEISKKLLVERFNYLILDKFDIKQKVNSLQIGNFKAKWGSCDSLNVIKLNWKMVMLPLEIIDFIIYHELSHLKELNHSNFFYCELQKFCPKHKELRKKLKEFSFLLTLY